MSTVITGAVNGVPTMAEVGTSSVNPVTIPYFPTGVSTTLDVDTDGSGLHAPNHRVAVVCGNTSFRDHLPFEIQNVGFSGGSVSGPGTVYPFDTGTLNAGQLCFAYYLVKRWRISINISRHVPDGLGGFEDIPIVGEYFADTGYMLWFSNYPPINTPFTAESQLVTPRGTTNGDDLTTSNFGIFVNDFEVNGAVYGRTASFLGDLCMSFVLDIDVPNGPATYQDPATGFGGTLLNFLGEVYVIYSIGGGYSGTVDVAPAEYWPYATIAGDPVYDTSTGAQLTDPLG